MIDIIYKLIDLIKIFIDGIFNIQIEFINGQPVSLGIIILAYLFIIIAIYLVFKAVGIKKEEDD